MAAAEMACQWGICGAPVPAGRQAAGPWYCASHYAEACRDQAAAVAALGHSRFPASADILLVADRAAISAAEAEGLLAATLATGRPLTDLEAARLAGCAENTLRRWIRSGADEQLQRAVIQLPGGHLRIRRAAFEHWLDDRIEPTGGEG